MFQKERRFTGKESIIADWNKRDTLSTQLNVLADFNPIVSDENKEAEIIVLGNLHPIVQNTVLDQVDTNKKCIILDTMNFWMDNALRRAYESYTQG